MPIKSDRDSSPFWWGAILIIIGFFLLLWTLGVMDLGPVFATWWPLIPVGIGLLKLRGQDKVGGAIFFLAGLVFLTATLDILNWGNILRLWPLVIVVIGISMILKRRERFAPGLFGSREMTDSDIRGNAIFGGLDRTVTSKELTGGDIMALFGGVELDLRQAVPSSEGCRLNLTALFGGIEVKVPNDWKVVVTGSPILGGIEDKTAGGSSDEKAPEVIFRCTAAFGAVEIRH